MRITRRHVNPGAGARSNPLTEARTLIDAGSRSLRAGKFAAEGATECRVTRETALERLIKDIAVYASR